MRQAIARMNTTTTSQSPAKLPQSSPVLLYVNCMSANHEIQKRTAIGGAGAAGQKADKFYGYRRYNPGLVAIKYKHIRESEAIITPSVRCSDDMKQAALLWPIFAVAFQIFYFPKFPDAPSRRERADGLNFSATSIILVSVGGWGCLEICSE